jgi:hypothetical protein
MSSVYDFLLSIADSLGDGNPQRPFRRYRLSSLTAFYAEAMCFVASHRPDLFTDFVIMKLEPGSYQDARCCGCTNVVGVVAQIDVDGNTVKDLSNSAAASTQVNKWFRAPCRVTTDGEAVPTIGSVTLVAGMNGVFTVTPPVPVGVDMWVKIKCVKAGGGPTEAQVLAGAGVGSCKFLPAVRSYIMYRALLGDRHAVNASSDAQSELKNAYAYLGLQMKMEEQQENA